MLTLCPFPDGQTICQGAQRPGFSARWADRDALSVLEGGGQRHSHHWMGVIELVLLCKFLCTYLPSGEGSISHEVFKIA